MQLVSSAKICVVYKWMICIQRPKDACTLDISMTKTNLVLNTKEQTGKVQLNSLSEYSC